MNDVYEIIRKAAESLSRRLPARVFHRTLMMLAVMVVFATTYLLILPAITLDENAGKNLPGFVLESGSTSSESDHTAGQEDPESPRTDRTTDKEDPEETEKTATARTAADEKPASLKYNGGDYVVKASFVHGSHVPAGTVLRVKEHKAGAGRYRLYHTLVRDELLDSMPDYGLKELSLYEVSFTAPNGKKLKHVKADLTITFEYGTRLLLSDQTRGIVCTGNGKNGADFEGNVDLIEKNQYANTATGKRNDAVMRLGDKVTALSFNNYEVIGEDTETLFGLAVLEDVNIEEENREQTGDAEPVDGSGDEQSEQAEPADGNEDEKSEQAEPADGNGAEQSVQAEPADGNEDEKSEQSESADGNGAGAKQSGEAEPVDGSGAGAKQSGETEPTDDDRDVKVGKPDSADDRGTDLSGKDDQAVDGSSEDSTVDTSETSSQYLAGTLAITGEDYAVSVEVDEKAQIPEGAELYARELTDTEEYRKKAQKKLGLENPDVVRFYDIGFTMNGKEIEPKASVHVTLKVAENIDAQVVHFTDKDVEVVKEVQVSHNEEKPDTKKTPKRAKGKAAENQQKKYRTEMEFDASGFSVYGIVGTVIEKTVLASDGKNYHITVTCDADSGIPKNTELEVSEITEGSSANGKSYEEYVAQTEDALGWQAGSISYARIFDISIVDKDDHSIKYQPAPGKIVDVRIKLDDAVSDELSVVHFADDSNNGDIIANNTETVNDGTGGKQNDETNKYDTKGQIVNFEAEGFSVYAIADHEGGEIKTPRVEFHFIDPDYTEHTDGTGYTYAAAPYEFVNVPGEYQTTQILKDGEGLEMITNPHNKANPDRYFYGWYIVDSDSEPDASSIVYTWTEDPQRILLETPISISVSGSTVTWELGDASGTGTVDEDGLVHVFLAPIYEDYYFVNFHLGPKENHDMTGGSDTSSTIMTRKLIILGNDGSADVRIGNVQAPTPDAVHKVFAGWETVKEGDDGLETDELYLTLNLQGEEIDHPDGANGYYMTVTEKKDIDLYPVFSEARWVYFHTGKAGNGAAYVGAKSLLTSDDIEAGTESPYYFESLPVSQRNGYRFMGWYTEEDSDDNGIGDRLTDEDGNLIENYVKYDTDGTTKLYEIVDGKLYFYKAMEDLHLYAKWEEVEDTSYTVIIWKQKVTDDVNAYSKQEYNAWVALKKAENPDITDEQLAADAAAAGITIRDYDYEDHIDIDEVSGRTLAELDISQYQNREYEGFHYGTTAMTTETVKGDGTTVVNIYYDRNVHTLRFYVNGTGYTYTKTTSNDGTQYGFVDGQPVQLNRVQTGSDLAWYFQYVYNNSNTGAYRIYNNTRTYVDRNNSTGQRYSRANGNLTNNRYYGTRYTRSGSSYQNYTYTPSTDTSGNLFGVDSHDAFVELLSTSVPVYAWTYVDSNGVTRTYTGTRYTRSNNQPNVSNVLVYSKTALFQQNIADIFPIVGTNGTTYDNGERWNPENSSTFNQVLVFLDIMPDEDIKFNLSTSNNTVKTLTYYVETLPGEPVEVIRNGVGYKTYHETKARYGYFTESEDFFDIIGFTKKESNPAFVNGEVRNSNTLDLYYTRNSSNLTFDSNYPRDQIIYFDGEQWDQTYNSEIKEYEEHSLLYESPLSSYGPGGADHWEPKVPDYYTFDGWYEDATCTVPFDFNSAMPAANKVVYAKWTPVSYRIHIDPNGAEIDHIDHNGEPTFRGDLNYHNEDKATYINAQYGLEIAEYTLTRDYVPISDAVAETMESDEVYYYIYTKYYEDTGRGLPADLRNAIYVTEDEIDDYYQYYVGLITKMKQQDPARYNEVTILGPAAWRNAYVSEQKYRKKYPNERYELLGWFKNDEDTPYNFSDPVEESFTLTAHWRLDGGYTVDYIPEYIMPDGTVINGSIQGWDDPYIGATYADQATTTIMHQPTAITANGTVVDDDTYIFRGWRLVTLSGTDGNHVYTPIEDGVFYQEGDQFKIEAEYADSNGIIYLEAVYEEKNDSYRRPKIANLTLDANSGYISTDGESELDTNQNLDPVGRVGVVSMDADADQIIFGDIQSNIALHVNNYAESPNYFVHPEGHVLLGFDEEPDEGDYVATYAADSIISVQRTDEETLYAVWEPLVYINFVNNTGVGDVTFSLSSNDNTALYVVNAVNGTYERTVLNDLTNITVPEGKTLRLAIPQGAEKNITISGTNSLGAGYILLWDSDVTIGEDRYDTSISGSDVDYPHAIGENTHTHTLTRGSAENQDAFSFDETLITHENGITVTFTSLKHDRTLVLHDNYQENTQEIYFADPLAAEPYDLPTPSTRIGYEFVGWDTERLPDNTFETPDYPVGTPVPDVSGFFGDDTVKTLYAVWKARAERGETFVYKLVPDPGDQSKEFGFTVSISGRYYSDYYERAYDMSQSNNTSGNSMSNVFALKHGQYLKISTSKDVGTSGANNNRPWIQAVVEKHDTDDSIIQTVTLKWQSNQNIRGSVQFDGYAYVNVTENDYTSDHYDTSIEKAAETVTDILTVSDADRNVRWTNTDAGGTVFYNNVHQTTDITVKKTLIGNTAAGLFGYTASYMLDGNQTDLGSFNVTSGSETGYVLEGVPVGATLTVTENDNINYHVSTAFENGSTDTDAADNTVTFEVPADGETVVYTNTLKSYPVKIVKVDQDGNGTGDGDDGIEARFDLKQDTSNIVSGRYTTPGDNIIYDGVLYAGSYTLTETWTQDGYLGLDAPVALTLSGDGNLVSDNNDVVVSGNAVDGFTVSVKNYETKNVTIHKALQDPLVSQRTFRFTAEYTVNGVRESFPAFSIISNVDSDGSYVLTVPIGASLTVTEDMTGIESVYDVSITEQMGGSAGGGDPGSGGSGSSPGTGSISGLYHNSYTIAEVNDSTDILFSNTRKTATITVSKRIECEPDNNTEFRFTAQLRNGSNPLPSYQVIGSDAAGQTDENGAVMFDLAAGQTQTLSVPVGTVLVLSENTEDYTAEITSAHNVEDSDQVDNSFTMTVTGDDTITFNNKRNEVSVILKKIGVDSTTQEVVAQSLGGAVFTIFEEDGETVATGKIAGSDQRLQNLTSSGANGVFFDGKLDIGTYYLHEIKAPDGYYRLAEDLKMEVAADGTVTIYGLTSNTTAEFNPVENVCTAEVKNYIGYALPSTGGPGTNLIYLLGIMLTGLAGVGLGMKRRKRKAA